MDHTVFDFEYFFGIVVFAGGGQEGVPSVEVPAIEERRPCAIGTGRGPERTASQNRRGDTRKNAILNSQQAKILLDAPPFVIKPGHTLAYAN